MKKAAIFDIDNTLVKGSTAGYFGKMLFKKGVANPFMVIRLLFYTIQFKMGILNVKEAMEKNKFFTGGHTVKRYRFESKEAFESLIKYAIYKDTKELLDKHKSDGYIIIIASSGLEFLAEPVGQFLNADFTLGTKVEIIDGIVTGVPIEPIPYGTGKRDVVVELCKKEDIDLQESYFYSDSFVDLPLLEVVGHPVAVNPNKKLQKVVKNRNWDVISCKEFLIKKEV